jgi:serine/threonine-protein kinase
MASMPETAVRSDAFGLVGSVLSDRYRVERQVAQGGFSVVYQARQATLDRPVAIKVLKVAGDLDEGAIGRFYENFAAEARVIARLRHPHIVDVYDFGFADTPMGTRVAWMALEWLDGETLEDRLIARRGRGGRSPAEVLNLMRPVLQAVAYAHGLGIAHRDIKPGNIMVVPTEHGDHLRLLDLGIAKLMAGDENAGSGNTFTARAAAFTPAYAAPEQISCSRTGPWTDVHALGLILTELLTDEPAFGQGDGHLLEEIMSTKRPTPAARGKVVGYWEPVLARALRLAPSERWKDAGALLAALEECSEETGPAAGQNSPTENGPLLQSRGGTQMTTDLGGTTSSKSGPVVTRERLLVGLVALLVMTLTIVAWLWTRATPGH